MLVDRQVTRYSYIYFFIVFISISVYISKCSDWGAKNKGLMDIMFIHKFLLHFPIRKIV
ncbi:hypothetical protein D3C87_1696070 [compost metagenome]